MSTNEQETDAVREHRELVTAVHAAVKDVPRFEQRTRIVDVDVWERGGPDADVYDERLFSCMLQVTEQAVIDLCQTVAAAVRDAARSTDVIARPPSVKRTVRRRK